MIPVYDLTEISDRAYGQFCHMYGLNETQRIHQVAYMGWIRQRQEVAQREAAQAAWAARDNNDDADSEAVTGGSDGGYRDTWH